MNKEKEKMLLALLHIKELCDTTDCNDCIFNLIKSDNLTSTCMFDNDPYEWRLSDIFFREDNNEI